MSSCGCGCCSIGSLAALQVLVESLVQQLENFNIGEGGIVLTPLPMQETDAAVIGADVLYHEIFSGAEEKRYIQILNSTDGDIYISFDELSNNFRISAGSSLSLNLSSNKTFWNGVVYAKTADALAPPTLGTIFVSAYS